MNLNLLTLILSWAFPTALLGSTLTVQTDAGGQLREKLSSNVALADTLIISGILNAEDWKYLAEDAAIKAAVKTLDLKHAEFALDGAVYRSFSSDAGSMGVTNRTEYAFWPTDSTSTRQILEGGVTTIWGKHLAGAFRQTHFQHVKLPASLEALGECAFMNASQLEGIEFGGCEKSIGNNAFAYCHSLKHLNLPSTTDSIAHEAFKEVPLEEIDLSCVSRLGERLFQQNKVLRRVVLHPELEKIQEKMFSECTALETIVLPASLRQIGISAFSYCSSLAAIELPASLRTLSARAFAGCSALKRIDLPQDIEEIGDAAFDDCRQLTQVDIPEGLYRIGLGAFSDTPFLESLKTENGIRYIGRTAYDLADKHIASLAFKEGTAGISPEFCSYSEVKTASLPKSLKWIGYRAFDNAHSLRAITLPEGLREIGEAAFAYTPLTALTLPSTIETIGDRAFSGTQIVSLTIPEGLKEMGEAAFGNNLQLADIRYNAVDAKGTWPFRESSVSSISIGPKVRTIPDRMLSQVKNCTISHIRLPEGLEEIGREAFALSTLEEINWPASLRRIEDYAFCYTRLKKVVLGEALTYVGDEAFAKIPTLEYLEYRCANAASSYSRGSNQYGEYEAWGRPFVKTTASEVVFGEKVREIAPCFFEDSQFKADIVLPESLEKIGHAAFADATITGIRFPSKLKIIPESVCCGCYNLGEIVLPDSAEVVGDYAFSGCFTTMPELPPTLKHIGERAFFRMHARGLSCLHLPPYLESIGAEAFCNDSGGNLYERIFIPQTVRHIGTGAFIFSSRATYNTCVIAMPTEVPVTEDGNPFDNKYYSNNNQHWQLVVPEQALKKYRSADGWKNFGTFTANAPLSLSDTSQAFTADFSNSESYPDFLKGIVVNHVYHSCDFISSPGMLQQMDEALMEGIEGKRIENHDLYDLGFRGLIMELPAGRGVVEITLREGSTGEVRLKTEHTPSVKIENQKEKQCFDYDVEQPTYLYIYGTEGCPSVRQISIVPEASAIQAPTADCRAPQAESYRMDGRRAKPGDTGIIIERGEDGKSARKIVR